MTTHAPLAAECVAPLGQRCLQHLRQEDDFWAHAHGVLRALDEAIRAGHWATLSEAAPEYDRLAQECGRLRTARRQLLFDLAAALQTTVETLTLAEIAKHLPPPYGEQILVLREHLRWRADEVHRLGRACAVRAEYQASFLHRFFGEITGSLAGVRYGPAGTLQASTCRSLVQARG